jgi:superfamily II DNA/RNA helicase
MDSSMHFSDLGLAPALLRAVSDMGVAKPTPIQVQAIPAVLQGRDVWAAAPTGSGKTLAFALPLVQQRAARQGAVGYRRPVRTLVLVPTRELAVQAGEVITRLAYPLNLRVAVVHGGVSINPQMMALRGGADMVVATPGRLLDLVDHNAVKLGDVQHLVLDEADRLLDAGFAEEWQRVLALVPAQRQTLVFSATLAPRIRAPLASAIAILAGSHCPSSGKCTPPTASATFRCGYIALISLGEISCTSTSKIRAIVA